MKRSNEKIWIWRGEGEGERGVITRIRIFRTHIHLGLDIIPGRRVKAVSKF